MGALDFYDCKICKIGRINVFSYLTLEELETISTQKYCLSFKIGELVYRQNNHLSRFFCIKKGIIKIYKTGPRGRPQIIRFAKKGDIIGYRSVLSKEAACTSAEALTEVSACQISSKNLFELIYNNPSFSMEIMKMACLELGEANDYIMDLAQKTVKERLAEVIIKLTNDFGLDSNNFLQIPLTREDMAGMVGTATESLIRQLAELKSDMLIESKGRKIKIMNIDELKRIAKGFQ